MNCCKLVAAALFGASMMAAGAASAKTLVYCSEGSPENFTPQINTTGTSLDAARPVYNQLVAVRAGLHQRIARPRRKLVGFARTARP